MHIPVADWEGEKTLFLGIELLLVFFSHTHWLQSCAYVCENLLTRGCITTCITNYWIVQIQQLLCAFLHRENSPAKTLGGKNNCTGQHPLKTDICWPVCLPVPSLHQKAAMSHGKMSKTPKHWSKEIDLPPHCPSCGDMADSLASTPMHAAWATNRRKPPCC